MVLEKVNYEDGKTVIQAKNLNDIQDAVIANQRAIEAMEEQAAKANIVNAAVE